MTENDFFTDAFEYLPLWVLERYAGCRIYIPHSWSRVFRDREITRRFSEGEDRRALAREFRLARWEMSRILKRTAKSAKGNQ